MNGPFVGGCLCGRVRYKAEGPARFASLCYCRDCQKASGSGHVPIMGVAKSGFKVEGGPARYVSLGGSGQQTQRNFCPDCGSLLYGTPTIAPEMVIVYAGSLDDPSAFDPVDKIFDENRNHWDTGGAGLKGRAPVRG